MNKRQSDTPQTGLPNIKLCPSCGFPNKNTDSRCSYCETPLNLPNSLSPIPWAGPALSRVARRWKTMRGHRRARSPIGRAATAVAGLALCGIGGYIFTASVFTKNFSSALLSLFFLLYGVAALKQLSGRHK